MGDRLKDRVAVVTAAGSGIGRAIAQRFAAEGAIVVVNDIRAEGADEVTTEIERKGGRASSLVADVSQSAEVNRLVAEAVGRFGRLDVMVNNAAAPALGRVDQMSDHEWHAVFSVTLDATFYGLRAAIPPMVAQGGGAIINTASAAGLGGAIGLGAYGSAKAAVVNLTKTTALENADKNVRVNAICPGSIATPPLLAFVEMAPGGRESFERQIPARRIGTAEEIANVALFLASDEASYVTGAVIVADGGVLAAIGGTTIDFS